MLYISRKEKHMNKSEFGKFIESSRRIQDLSLKKFCKKTGENPGNWLKIERGLKKPPTEEKRLMLIAIILNEDFDILEKLAKSQIRRENAEKKSKLRKKTVLTII